MSWRDRCRPLGQPGAYIDDDGGLHLDLGEMLRAGGWPDTVENRATLERACRELFARELPQAPVTVVEEGVH